MTEPYLDVTDAAGFAFMTRGIQGPVTMLNLLRFRPVADYSAFPEIDPGHPISGREAYDLYSQHTNPFLAASGGEVVFFGDGGPWLIGPVGEVWDAALLVRQSSVEAFIAFNGNAEYLAGIGHRTAALLDSRLLPLIESNH